MFNKILDFLVPFGPYLRERNEVNSDVDVKQLVLHVIPFTFFIHWLFTFIPYGSLLYFIILVPLSARRHITLKNINVKYDQVFTYLWYLVILIAGIGGLRGFIGHFFLSEQVAESIGWEIGTPFQLELAFYHLGIALASFMTVWTRKNITEGIAVIKIVFLLGAAYVHLKDIISYQNYSPNNTGTVLVGDIVIPLIYIYLLFLMYKYKPKN